MVLLFFFKQKTAYELRISDWSSDVCSSDLSGEDGAALALVCLEGGEGGDQIVEHLRIERVQRLRTIERHQGDGAARFDEKGFVGHSYLLRHSGEGRNLDGETPACAGVTVRSEEHTSELQSLMRISDA